MFLPNKVHANKLVPHSELMIFIRYEDNSYYFIYFIAKDIKVQYFGFITQDFLRYFLFEISNKCTIIYMSCSYNSKLPLEIW